MKRIYLLGLPLLAIFFSNNTFSQCSLNATAVDGVILNGVSIGNAGISVAYNPNADLYYAVEGGGPAMNIVTFNGSGTEVYAGINSNYDFRGVWWNPNLNQLECNGWNTTMLRVNDLDGNQYALNTGVNIFPAAQPDIQSQGDYDWDANEIIYHNSGTIYRYDRNTNGLIGSYPITGLPVAVGNLSYATIGYTGCPGQEIVVYDITNKTAYLIDKSTGAYVASSVMPASAPSSANWYDYSYCNKQMFIRSGNSWYGYYIFQPCLALNTSVSATDICVGDEVTLTASGLGTVTWDNGVTDGVAFMPPLGSTTYTATSTDGSECSFSVEIVANVIPTVDGGADIIDCSNTGDIVLAATYNADVISWDNGVMDNVPFAPTYGSTQYVVTAANGGCMVTDTVNVLVGNLNISLYPSDEMNGNDGSIALTINSGIPPYSFDWDNDGTGDNDDSNDLYFQTSGTYTVTITDGSGCTMTESATIGSQVGIDENELVDFTIYPNPVTDVLHISSSSEFNNITIYNSRGEQIYVGQDKSIDLHDVASGIYLINIKTDSAVITKRFTKK